MKKNRIFFALILVFILASACHHDKNRPAENLLAGEWILVEVTGGFSGEGYDPPFNQLHFTEDLYELTFNETVISSGTYTFDPAAEHGLVFNPAGSQPSPAVGFEDHDKGVTFEGEHVLILADPCCDLFVYRFEREGSGGNE